MRKVDFLPLKKGILANRLYKYAGTDKDTITPVIVLCNNYGLDELMESLINSVTPNEIQKVLQIALNSPGVTFPVKFMKDDLHYYLQVTVLDNYFGALYSDEKVNNIIIMNELIKE